MDQSQNHPLSSDELSQLIVSAFDNYQVDRAHELKEQFLKKVKDQPEQFQITTIQRSLFTEIDNFYSESEFLISQLKDNQGWTSEKMSETATMSYKLTSGNSTISLKWEEVLHAPVINACALIYQTDMFDKWLPFCTKSYNISKISKAHKVAGLLLNFPVLNNREAFVRGYGLDRLDIDDSFLLSCKSVHEDKQYLQKYNVTLPQSGRSVLVDLKFFTIQVTIVDRVTFIFKSVCNVDPKIGFIPFKMINFFTQKFAGYIFKKFVTIANNLTGTDWEKEMKKEENQDFYGWLNARFDEYYTKRNI